MLTAHITWCQKEKKKRELIFKKSNTRFKVHYISACHASPKPYLRKISSDNLLTKLNHEACILWNWIWTSKFTGKNRFTTAEDISKTRNSQYILKCHHSIDWENCQNNYTFILLWIFMFIFLISTIFLDHLTQYL